MTDELLPYYNKELAYIRNLGAQFAKKHPKIAGRLKISEDTVEDPHVSRLIESFAFLTARIRHKLDDSFPELTDALLGVLYPDYQTPLPSSSIMQITPQDDASAGYSVPKHTELETFDNRGEACYFRTTSDTTVWPVTIKDVRLMGLPFTAPSSHVKNKANAVLKIELECAAEEMTFAELNPDKLRFFIKGQDQHTYKLHEIIQNSTLGVALATSNSDADAIHLDSDSILPFGFDEDEKLLPYSHRSFSGYRLLAEYFLFPQKFLFFELDNLSGNLSRFENRLEVYIYLGQTQNELEQTISKENLALNCTPIINLFKQRAEPILLTDMVQEYHVVPDIRQPDANEVHTITRVSAVSPEDKEYEFKPFYGTHREHRDTSKDFYWHARRESSEWAGGQLETGTEVHLSLIDLNFTTVTPGKRWTLNIDTLCTNRNLPNHLPFGSGKPEIQLVDGTPEITELQCMTPPTKTKRPGLKENTRWQLMSHLTLNHFSSDDGLQVLKETLKLYDFANAEDSIALIDGITAIETGTVTSRVHQHGRIGVCQGTSVLVEFDESQYSGNSYYLLASILDKFFSQFCTINSFTKFSARLRGKERPFATWPPRSGTQELI